jgi:hypothetical protein
LQIIFTCDADRSIGELKCRAPIFLDHRDHGAIIQASGQSEGVFDPLKNFQKDSSALNSLFGIDVRQLQGEQIDQGCIRDLASPSERGNMQRAIDQMKDRIDSPFTSLLDLSAIAAKMGPKPAGELAMRGATFATQGRFV